MSLPRSLCCLGLVLQKGAAVGRLHSANSSSAGSVVDAFLNSVLQGVSGRSLRLALYVLPTGPVAVVKVGS